MSNTNNFVYIDQIYNQINNEPNKPLGNLPMFEYMLTKEKQDKLIKEWSKIGLLNTNNSG